MRLAGVLKRRASVPLWTLLAAAAVVATGVGVVAGRSAGDVDTLRKQLAAERATDATAKADVAAAKRAQSNAQDAVASLTQELASARATTTTRPVPTTPATTLPAVPGFPGNGTFRVGADIQPGTYRSAGPSGTSSCYWARLRNLTGRDDIIANSLERGPSLVTVSSSDVALNTSGCQRWEKVD